MSSSAQCRQLLDSVKVELRSARMRMMTSTRFAFGLERDLQGSAFSNPLFFP